MTELHRFMGISEFVEQVTRELAATPLRSSYPSRTALARQIAQPLSRLLAELLTPLTLPHRLWQGDINLERGEWVEPALVFGTEFTPDVVVEIADSPTLAVLTQPVRPGRDASRKVASALGEALLYSHLYPAVVVLLHRPGVDAEYKHLWDREIMNDLWRTHKIRLILR